MEQGKQHITDIIFVLSLFCVFAVLALFVVVLGANVYKGISENMTKNYNVRTSVAYVTEKIRQNDVQDGISVEALGDSNALVLSQTEEGKTYQTWIYVAGGKLKEVMVREGTSVTPSDGQAIMELSEMDFKYANDNLIQISVEDIDGNEYSSLVGVKSGI